MRSFRRLATALSFLGVLIAMLVGVASAWADYEGLSYFSTGAAFEPFQGLHCPVLLSQAEVGIVSSAFGNPTAKTIEPYYEVEISGLTDSRQLEGHLVVGPGLSQDVKWTVDARDVDLGYFVLVKVDVLPVAGYRTREATCGILVVPLPGLTGNSAVFLIVIVSMLCMLVGFILPVVGVSAAEAARLDMEASTPWRRLIQTLGIVSAMAMLSGLAGWWLPALLLFAISLLLLLLSLRYANL
jgi:hypothetical protein